MCVCVCVCVCNENKSRKKKSNQNHEYIWFMVWPVFVGMVFSFFLAYGWVSVSMNAIKSIRNSYISKRTHQIIYIMYLYLYVCVYKCRCPIKNDHMNNSFHSSIRCMQWFYLYYAHKYQHTHTHTHICLFFLRLFFCPLLLYHFPLLIFFIFCALFSFRKSVSI